MIVDPAGENAMLEQADPTDVAGLAYFDPKPADHGYAEM
jgi:hypothetical protein